MISKLHFITQDIPGYSHAELAEHACKGGADWVQLRVKGKSYEESLKIAQEIKSICKKYRASLIINDSVPITREIDADGVHLGKEDMNPKEARKILGNNFIIGGSTNTIEDAQRMVDDGVNYIGVGPYRFTSTKEKINPILGLEGIRTIAEKFKNQIPVIAIGGIKLEDVELLMQTGIHGIAVSSAINFAEDKTRMAGKFLAKLSIEKTLTLP